jgi:23S rRNA pseudouridine1911/1915/1917 synthase
MSNKDTQNITIIYEDDNCLVINKPANTMVHPDGRSGGPYLTDWIVSTYPKIAGIGEPVRDPEGNPIDRPGIVHRLDRETSGALIIAKTQEAHAHLKAQFQDRTITKKYLAFVWGEMKEEFGTITKPIGRSVNDFRKWSAQRGARGEVREAETYWTRLFSTKTDGGQKFSLIEAEPKTGRTHQIRVHFVAIQHPIVGDRTYAPKRDLALGFDRVALHSRSVEFATMEGKTIKVVAPLPEDFVVACKELGVSYTD